ncbi:MAG: carboxypeptidase regulatory-like domain-containing protein, partial [Ginsengibacter sp.]
MFLLLSCITTRTQVIISTITVKGTVADSITGKPIAYVTVALLDVKTGIAVKNTLTKGDGSFEITGPGNRSYQLALTFTGYEVKLIPSI